MDEPGQQQPAFTREQDLRNFVRSLETFHSLYEQPAHAAELLCQQIAFISQGYLQLILNVATLTNPSDIPVRYRKKLYGVLHINAPLPHASFAQDAQRLAEVCGWLLYGTHVATCLQKQLKAISLELRKPLTEQETAVLQLVGQHKSNHAIAQHLQIALTTLRGHLKNIYRKLGVHNKQEALLVANMLGLLPQGDTSLR